jgi:hypothetical protein
MRQRRFCTVSSKLLKLSATILCFKLLKRCGAGWQPAADCQSACFVGQPILFTLTN